MHPGTKAKIGVLYGPILMLRSSGGESYQTTNSKGSISEMEAMRGGAVKDLTEEVLGTMSSVEGNTIAIEKCLRFA